ncbi:MAG: hypothetical protein M5U34_46455 [Chloroflexi bacterium]|nr:hypothetical protein [Chloroflexota bacterium]
MPVRNQVGEALRNGRFPTIRKKMFSTSKTTFPTRMAKSGNGRFPHLGFGTTK